MTVNGVNDAGLVAVSNGGDALALIAGPTAELQAELSPSSDQVTSRYLTDPTGYGILDV